MNTTTNRPVTQIIDTVPMLEGAGLPVRRAYPNNQLRELDPFLLFDHFGPVTWGPGEASGVPDHPHRGFETVTYLLQGAMDHKDSTGGGATLNEGDVQWMTAGAGIVHSEMPTAEMVQNGGTLHGFQIWVNLPAKDKMTPPRYQDVPRENTPTAHSADGLTTVRVVAGEALGVKGAVETHLPITYLHVTLAPGGVLEQPVEAGHNAVAYAFGGSASAGPEGVTVEEGQMAVFGQEGRVRLENAPEATEAAELLILAGQPLNEPIARYGPFVMNTRQQLHEAVADYEPGRMGRIAPTDVA